MGWICSCWKRMSDTVAEFVLAALPNIEAMIHEPFSESSLNSLRESSVAGLPMNMLLSLPMQLQCSGTLDIMPSSRASGRGGSPTWSLPNRSGARAKDTSRLCLSVTRKPETTLLSRSLHTSNTCFPTGSFLPTSLAMVLFHKSISPFKSTMNMQSLLLAAHSLDRLSAIIRPRLTLSSPHGRQEPLIISRNTWKDVWGLMVLPGTAVFWCLGSPDHLMCWIFSLRNHMMASPLISETLNMPHMPSPPTKQPSSVPQMCSGSRDLILVEARIESLVV
mmetsp:Transcript_11472/g.28541  ORF Transcript_11472/g.28541 Transcript_11472/m.28541 type:complete len:277 (+) Transcript_11472:2620-3450(+)